MSDRRRPRHGARLAVAAVSVAVLAAGCGSAATPVARPSPSTTATSPPPSPSPSASPSASASPSRSLSPSPSAVPSTAPGPRSAYVRVSVATVWRSPSAPRAVDAPALRAPADIRGWLAAMSLDQRRGLQGRADTQVLLGDRVLVVAERGSWMQVRVPDQPTPLAAAGYPGWIPRVQLATVAPPVAASAATVIARTAWLYADRGTGSRVEVSFATRLPVLGQAAGWVRVAEPGGASGWLAASTTAVTGRTAPALPRTGADVVRTARMFLGLPYLWAARPGSGSTAPG